MFNADIILTFSLMLNACESYRILFLLPYNGSSHHGYYMPLIEELAKKNHELTVVNYLPLKNLTNVRQMTLKSDGVRTKRKIIMSDYHKNFPKFLREVFLLIENVQALGEMATTNCEKIFTNHEILNLIKRREKFDVFILEQFYSDCGLAWANALKAPVIGITAHVLMPWTYHRVGAPNNPAFVPNRIGQNGLLARIKAVFLNFYSNLYYRRNIQMKDHAIVSKVLPNTPDLEKIAKKMSLVLVNQYFPLTGSRLYGANVVEIGGMHVKERGVLDEHLLTFLNTAESRVVYISFGSVACGLPEEKIEAILKVIDNSKLKFIWKIDSLGNMTRTLPGNLMVRHWMPQIDILCHKNVRAFVTHSGMLSTIEAIHCGVPVISVPIFGDQFANAQSARDSGLGVTVDFGRFNEVTLKAAVDNVLEKRFQSKARYLSKLWQDRPLPPLDTAVYWVEYIARHQGNVNLRPPTVDLPLYQYLMLDVWITVGLAVGIVLYVFVKIILICVDVCKRRNKKKI